MTYAAHCTNRLPFWKKSAAGDGLVLHRRIMYQNRLDATIRSWKIAVRLTQCSSWCNSESNAEMRNLFSEDFEAILLDERMVDLVNK
jgi:hypothetical protein